MVSVLVYMVSVLDVALVFQMICSYLSKNTVTFQNACTMRPSPHPRHLTGIIRYIDVLQDNKVMGNYQTLQLNYKLVENLGDIK